MKRKVSEPMVRMADIAKRAGVSRTTASFVLNNRQAELRISEETRQRVMDAVRELGYRRNELARAVGTGKNYVLGYLKTLLASSETEALLLEGVLKAAAEADYLVKVLPAGAEPYQEVARRCIEQRLAGVVMRSYREASTTTAFCQELESYGIPVVFVDDDLALPGTSCVTSDDDQGYRLTIEHLVGLGHRQIAFIAGDSVHPQSIFRKESYQRMMAENGLPVPEGSILDAEWDVAQAEELTRQLFRNRSDAPTALVCAGDKLAAGVIRTLWRLGLRVPEDVSVIGYSDLTFTTLLYPPLTTISQPFEEMGVVATQLLLTRLQNNPSAEEIPPRVLLPTRLIVRESTTTAPVRLPVG